MVRSNDSGGAGCSAGDGRGPQEQSEQEEAHDAFSIIFRVRKPVVLITGAGGEIGHGLIERLSGQSKRGIVTLDLATLEPAIAPKVDREITGSILDRPLLERILAEYQVELVFHLAALLSTRSEFTPLTAHQVNVEGTLNLLEFAQHEAESHGRPVIFMYPSSIAVYGLPSLEEKQRAGRVSEDDCTHPTTMYGCNKLYCEQLGHYYSRHYKQLAAESASGRVDFRCVRFPGLISAVTMPSGGTSDYAPEMIHAAAKGEPYAASCGRTRASRSWRCPTGSRRCCAGGRSARRPDAHRLQRRRVQPVRRGGAPVVVRAFPAPTSRGRSTRSARASWTPGRPTSTTAPPGATGASRRATTSIMPSGIPDPDNSGAVRTGVGRRLV